MRENAVYKTAELPRRTRWGGMRRRAQWTERGCRLQDGETTKKSAVGTMRRAQRTERGCRLQDGGTAKKNVVDGKERD